MTRRHLLRPSTSRAIFAVLVLGTLSLALEACSTPDPNPGAGISKTTTAPSTTARVVRGDVTPVLTIDGTVGSGTSVDITSHVAGTFVVDSVGALSVVGARGRSYPIKLSKEYRDVTALQPNLAKVVPGLPLVRATYAGFTLQAELSPVDLLKFTSAPVSAKAQIIGTGGPFDCVLLDPRPTPGSGGNSGGAASISCAIPSSEKVIAGLSGILAIRFASTHNALVLPIAAVAGTRDQGEVYLKTAHGPVTTSVTLGATDGFRIVVTAGLSEGDVVYVPSPTLLNE
ncbi:MAG: hypothetical protein JWQ39_2493 [Glaciihabitans sp.]|nr:hypothetical protein [Glaciihabitans sp.]